MAEQKPYQNLEQGQGREADQEKLARLKQEILEMERKVAEKKSEAESMPNLETVSGVEGVVGKETGEFASIVPVPQSQPSISAQPQSILDPQNQVQMLCELAFQKGLDFAIKSAKEMNDPYVLDAFHDSLVDKLYERLISEKKIEEI